MTGWRKQQVIDMAREAEITPTLVMPHEAYFKRIERFAELVRADEAEKYKWDVHSCGPTCTKVGCVAVRKAVEAEREACAKVAEDDDHFVSGRGYHDQLGNADETVRNIAAAIRARGDMHD
jgi:hypothetical protein